MKKKLYPIIAIKFHSTLKISFYLDKIIKLPLILYQKSFIIINKAVLKNIVIQLKFFYCFFLNILLYITRIKYYLNKINLFLKILLIFLNIY